MAIWIDSSSEILGQARLGIVRLLTIVIPLLNTFLVALLTIKTLGLSSPLLLVHSGGTVHSGVILLLSSYLTLVYAIALLVEVEAATQFLSWALGDIRLLGELLLRLRVDEH